MDHNKVDNEVSSKKLSLVYEPIKNEILKCMTQLKNDYSMATRTNMDKSKHSFMVIRNTLKQIHSRLEELKRLSSNVNVGHAECIVNRQGLEVILDIFQGPTNSFDFARLQGDDNGEPKLNEENNIQYASSLAFILLKISVDEDMNEMCREKSSLLLQECINAIVKSLSKTGVTDSADLSGITFELHTNFISNLYIEYCFSMYSRFGFDSNGYYLKHTLSKREERKMTKSFEDAEEIRLLWIQNMSGLISFFNILISNMKRKNEIQTSIHVENLMAPTGLVCKVLSTCTLVDSHPELKRESCILVKNIAQLFPKVVVMNEEILLNAIIGCCPENLCTRLNTDGLIRHRHAKTRSLALETTVDIMRCHVHFQNGSNKTSSSIEERLVAHVLPQFEQSLAFDHSASVRISLIKAVGRLLETLLQYNDETALDVEVNCPTWSHCRLLILLVLGITDDIGNIKQIGMSQLELCADIFVNQKSLNTDLHTVHNQSTKLIDSELESGNSMKEIVKILNYYGGSIISILLQRLEKCSSLECVTRYLDALCFVFKALQGWSDIDGRNHSYPWNEAMIMDIVFLLSNILKENENEEPTYQAALFCAKALGKSKRSKNLAVQILGTALEDSDNLHNQFHNCSGSETDAIPMKLIVTTHNQCSSVVNIMASLIQGCYETYKSSNNYECNESVTICDELQLFCQSLFCDKVLESIYSSSSAAISLLSACHIMVRFMIDGSANELLFHKHEVQYNCIARDVTWCCVHLLCCPTDFQITDPILKIMNLIPCFTSKTNSSETAIQEHFKYMLGILVHESELIAWESDDRYFKVFDALIRFSDIETIGANVDQLIPVFEKYLGIDASTKTSMDQRNDQDVKIVSTKIAFMALIETIASQVDSQQACFEPFIERMILVAVIPNLAWKVGGLACALRKVASAVLLSLLKSECTTYAIMFKVSSPLLPLLKSILSDDDSSLRELAISSISIVFAKLPGELGEVAIQQLYPDLIKCLDDSSQNVRYLACDALKHFLTCAPASNFLGTPMSYIIEQLLVHMDDCDLLLKEKVHDVLLSALYIDPQGVVKGAQKALLSHSSCYYCNLLLSRATDLSL
jgi:hypothetical protein